MNQFNFFHCWYPVGLLEDLDPTEPKAITILGKQLVVWKPRHQDRYSVFLDQCPHRLAPLSEGRVDEKSDHLMCSYHGWEFDSEGNCQNIPQGENPDLLEKQGKNFCATALLTQEKQDMLWVWLDETTTDLAAKTPLPLSQNIDTEKGFVWSTYMRATDYDWQTLVENLVDPSHVPFAHHGLQGKRQMAKPLAFKITESNATSINAEVRSGFPTKITFKAPCLVEYEITFGPDKQMGLVTYCVPVTPGQSRLIVLFPRNFATGMSRFIPRWWEHSKLRNRVIDSDMLILQRQEYFVQQHPEDWKTAYKMPTAADSFVIEFRRWFDTYCGGKLPWEMVGIKPEETTIHENRRKVLDRYHQHTIHCSSCRTALKRIQWAKRIFVALMVALIAIGVILPDSARVQWGLSLLGFEVICGAIAVILHYKLEPEFYFVDYRHQEHE